jgi:hypothetical protein
MDQLAVADTTGAGPAPKQAHPDTSTIFVLGLLSLTPSYVFSICAWHFGNRLLRKYDAEPGRWSGRGWVVAGRIMGMVGLVLSVLVTIVFVIVQLA